ncbi:YIP1 family protein [Clostridium sp. D2Q-14]|uniref:Yip1 family protein n=1 Tax=Anaeromonas gelatinilytica TaxID=2683194 RepID=UPI00193AF1C5|nr:Yip1 family protein [Anaeromonas gelatinilytica]MBS4534719.1 YIP1 family protein [Anaeromonas gelatinilytica]
MNEENERESMMEDEKVSLGQKIKWYIVKPSRFFEYFKGNPKVLIHFIMIFILNAIATLISSSKTDEITNQLPKGMSAEQIELTQNIKNVFSSPIVVVITTLITVTVTYLIFAGVRYIFTKLFKGEGTFKKMFSLVLVTSYPVAIAGIFRSIFSDPVVSSDIMNSVLSKVNIWSIWQLVLLIIGIKVMFNISMKKSVIINVGIFVVTTFITVGSAIINSNLSNMVQ